jgi:hypothetical protein
MAQLPGTLAGRTREVVLPKFVVAISQRIPRLLPVNVQCDEVLAYLDRVGEPLFFD